MKPHRIRMAHNLVLAYGLYKKLEIYRPTLMSEEQMTKFHADDYIHFLQHVTPDNQPDYTTELTRYNLDVGETHTRTRHTHTHTRRMAPCLLRIADSLLPFMCAVCRLPRVRWHV